MNSVRPREELHAAEDEITRWTIVESEMRSMLGGVAAANLVRRHRIGEAALQVFKVSKQLVRLQEHADLLPHVERLRRMNRFARRRAKSPAEPQPQQLQPPS